MAEKNMFRYLLKYVGKYKVLTELTTDTHDFVRDDKGNIHPEYDELYIPCNYEGKIKHSYSDSILAYYTTKKTTCKKICAELDRKNISYTLDESDIDYIIFFKDSDMSSVAKIVGARTKGKKINPFDERNLKEEFN